MDLQRLFLSPAALFLFSLSLLSASTAAAQQGDYQFSNGLGHVTYTVTYTSAPCYSGSYQEWSYDNLVYVDWNGNQTSLGGGGAYFISPGGGGCPPDGPQPADGVSYSGTTSGANYQLNFYADESTPSSSTDVALTQCSIDPTFEGGSGYTWVTLTTCPTGTVFFTTDGSEATEASEEYTGMFRVPAGSTINAVVAQMEDTNGNYAGVVVQNGQTTVSNWKTVLASTESQSAPYSSSYNSPTIDYCSTEGCNDGVQGIPTAITFEGSGSLSFPSAWWSGWATAASLGFTTENLQDTFNGQPGNPSAPNGTQVLWPYNAGTGCDSCTSMVQDFYIWPQHTSSVSSTNVQNWEMDLQGWNTGSGQWFGASLQCSGQNGGWEYNGQEFPGWTMLHRDTSGDPLNHDCPLPFGTLSATMGASDTQFTVIPNTNQSTVEPGMIVMIDNEEIFCQAVSGNTCTSATRGYGGTSATAHSIGAPWAGSVHVQYHVSLIPGNNNVYIDYLNLNYNTVLNPNSTVNHYDFHQIYGTQQVDGTQVSLLYVPSAALPSGYPDRVFDQKQIDVAPGIGSASNPVQVGEFTDEDNVTASYGILGSTSFVVPDCCGVQ